MTTSTTTDAITAETPPRGAVIATSGRDGGFCGRYLQHAPGPAATVDLLRGVFAARYHGRRGYEDAIRELIEHPSGWARLGTSTSRDPQIKPRRAPAPAGTCVCHLPDGTPHPALINAALATLHDAEIRETGWIQIPHGDLGDGSPWKVRSGQVPDGIDYVYVFARDGMIVKARDGAYRDHGTFTTAVSFAWDLPPAPEEIERACAQVRARTPADLANEQTAAILADTARQLAQIPAHHDLVLHLLSGAGRYLRVPAEHTPEAALARAAGLHPAHLAGHLHQLERGEQVRLLHQAAHHLDPTTHPAA